MKNRCLSLPQFPINAWLSLVLLMTLAATARAEGPYRVETQSPLVVVGDVHGAYGELVSVLRIAGLVDESLSWTGADTHLVSVGDLLGRGDDSRKAIDLLRRLQDEARAAGGAVYVLLGNHEVLNLTRDLRYLTPAEMASFAEFDPQGEADELRGHRAAFAPGGPYGQWLLDLPLAIVVNRNLIVHAGISEDLLAYNLEEISNVGRAQLRQVVSAMERLVAEGLAQESDGSVDLHRIGKAIAAGDPDLTQGQNSAAIDPELVQVISEMVTNLETGLAFGPDGPLWYQGSASCHPFTERPLIDQVLEHFDVDRILVGHTPTRDGRLHQRMEGKVVRVDTGMNTAFFGGSPSAVRITQAGLEAVYPEEGPGIVAESARVWDRPYGMDDLALEQFLQTAEVVKVEELDVGITKPKRLTLREGERTLRAVFKNFDSDPGLERSWRRLADKADRYQYDVAAYRLDRLLGLEMVPPAVLRDVEGTPGAVQLWVENAVNEKARKEQQLGLRPVCSLKDQYNLMNAFDALILNDDRNLSNMLYTRPDWKVWLIDHTRAFRSDKRLPRIDATNSFVVTEPMARALESMTDDALDEALGSYLHTRQLRGLKARRDRMIKLAR